MHLFTPAKRDEWARVCWREGAFTDAECARILDLAKQFVTRNATIGNAVSSADLRQSKIAWIASTSETGWLYDKISELTMNVNNERYRFDLSGFTDDLQYTEYEASGHYDWHQDFDSGDFSTRKLSIVVQLSDPAEYEGGDLQLFGRKPEVPRTRGTAVFFPSFEFHRVNPVTKGVRRTLVSWAVGPTYR